MKIRVIGTGAAGNKAAINLIEKGILDKERVMLLNSTLRDIPENYKSLGIKFSNTIGGCGKERDLAKNLCLSSFKDGTLQTIDTFFEPDDEACVIVNSSEGGTGCGSACVIGKYISQVIGLKVIYIVFTGFEEDIRGLQNTIEYFQDLNEDCTVQAISNKKFLEETNGNKIKAEKLANDEFANRISVLTAMGIVDSEQNIDETDMYKVATIPGFMTIGKVKLDKIKNQDQFNKVLTSMVDNDKSLDISVKSQKRLAVFINAKEETIDNIDYNFSVLKNKLGIPYEVFNHIQYNEEQPEFISFISAGMKMPIDEVKEVYEKYKKETEKVNKAKDNFFNFASELKGNSEDNLFNIGGLPESKRTTVDKISFFDSFDKEMGNEIIPRVTEVTNTGKFNNTENKVSKDEFLKKNF